MFHRFSRFAGRKAVLATAAVLALTSVAPTASFAGGRHWHGGGGALAGAAIAGAIGTGLAIAATRDAYAYDPGPGYYYGGGPVYYSSPAYGPGYYYGSGYAEQYGGYTKVCSHGWSGYACY
jgi:hypothetical protein